jgi:hypothetical protein
LVGQNVTRSRLNILLSSYKIQIQILYWYEIQQRIVISNNTINRYTQNMKQLKTKSSMRAEEAKQLIHNVQSLHFQCLRLFERVISLCSSNNFYIKTYCTCSFVLSNKKEHCKQYMSVVCLTVYKLLNSSTFPHYIIIFWCQLCIYLWLNHFYTID